MVFAGCRQKSGHGWDLRGRGSAARGRGRIAPVDPLYLANNVSAWYCFLVQTVGLCHHSILWKRQGTPKISPRGRTAPPFPLHFLYWKELMHRALFVTLVLSIWFWSARNCASCHLTKSRCVFVCCYFSIRKSPTIVHTQNVSVQNLGQSHWACADHMMVSARKQTCLFRWICLFYFLVTFRDPTWTQWMDGLQQDDSKHSLRA